MKRTALPLEGLLASFSETVPVTGWINHLLEYAIAQGASDIHLESLSDGFSVRMRIAGVLRVLDSPLPELAAYISSHLKHLAALDLTVVDKPQDGRFAFVADSGSVFDFRLSCLPIVGGESLVLRLLMPQDKRLSLEELGMPPSILASMQAAASRSFGLILITGATGSGKTTTLYALLDFIATPHLKLITIEDPVEYRLDHALQIGVDSQWGATFSAILRTSLRHDPDVLVIGEIRDSETAKISVEAALTGHLVLATLHASDPKAAISRLLEMGVDKPTLDAVLAALLHQQAQGDGNALRISFCSLLLEKVAY